MLNTLLKGKPDCACGQVHTCDIQYVSIKSGAVKELEALCVPYRNILLVADNHTYATCGDYVATLLADKLADKIVFCPEGLLIPNEDAIARISDTVTQQTDLIIGIGSGVINDLCKYVSYCKHLPYFIVATAPSMDGYASVGAAMITENMKTTFSAHVPTAIIADVDILKDAPMRMIQSGFGDIVGKHSALNDWKLSQLINGEYFCEYVYNLVQDTLAKTEALADGIQKRDPNTIQTLMEALVVVGIAMSFVGNSRPASGSEHHLSHYFEIVGILKNEPYLLHGIDVAYSTVATQKMRERLLALAELPEKAYIHNRAIWKSNIRKRYDIASDGVIALQDKCGFYEKDYLQIYRKHWHKIRDILKETPSSEQIQNTLAVAGLDYREFEELYGKEKIDDCIWFAKDLKDRYTVLWLYFMLFREEKTTELHFKRPFAVAAHRGDCAYFPENTMAAFLSTIEKNADMIETDVHMTADGLLVLMHDATVDRTTDGTGMIKELPYQVLCKLNAGTAETPQQIPLFEELLKQIAETDMMLNIELKDYFDGTNRDFCYASVDKTIALLEKYHMLNKTVINSFDGFLLEYVHKKYPQYLLHGYYPYSIMHNVTVCPDEYLYCACIFEDENPALFQQLREKGIRPWVGAGVREDAQIQRCIAFGAELVTTNDPAKTIRQIEAALQMEK